MDCFASDVVLVWLVENKVEFFFFFFSFFFFFFGRFQLGLGTTEYPPTNEIQSEKSIKTKEK